MDPIASKGAKLQVTIATVLTDIPGLTNIKGPTDEFPTIECEGLDETVNIASGNGKPGQVTAEIFFNPTNTVHQFLYTNRGAEIAMRELYPNGAYHAFTGIINKLEPDFSAGAAHKQPLTITLKRVATLNWTPS